MDILIENGIDLSSNNTDNEQTNQENNMNEENRNDENKKMEFTENANHKSIMYDTLVVSGGSVKGYYLLGAIQYLYDIKYTTQIVNYIGTSVGSMICFLLVIGYTPIEIVTYLCVNKVLDELNNINLSKIISGVGIYPYSIIQDHLEKMTLKKIGYFPTFKDINEKFNKNFICITYNFTKFNQEILSFDTHPDMPCLTAIRMSSNLPFIFGDFSYENNIYLDGGLCNNFPIDVGSSIGNRILGVNINDRVNDIINTNDVTCSKLMMFYKIISIPLSELGKLRQQLLSDKCDIFSIKPENTNILNFNINTSQQLDMFSIGYQQIKSEKEF